MPLTQASVANSIGHWKNILGFEATEVIEITCFAESPPRTLCAVQPEWWSNSAFDGVHHLS